MKTPITLLVYLRKQVYNNHYFHDTRKIFRWGIVSTVIMVLLFGPLDRAIFPTGFADLYAIRLNHPRTGNKVPNNPTNGNSLPDQNHCAPRGCDVPSIYTSSFPYGQNH